ncbi:hypothetical protein HELRODRAFT_193588 [Helobdella robusta]|uniref:Mediator of RNA polymerase II transcription subunit 14 n=1 Tax=Helobdella robusta TaxID=6412 RepID=T1FV53_HELRO|nr:hypothetical protein HELRODRAFT_193588 [Helobdella robusta]ESN95203.1 hypothetical protein HELRODRAFT_193588 [Helobdella robusta]
MPPIEYANASQNSVMFGNVVPLSTLMEFLIQRTYHELSILSELLLGKNDLERKIEICQFANRTKQTFVRLLALVKWTNSANKVDKCARIFSFLQQQQLLFVETADCLARMARETLVHARLPSFSLPCAIDVLMTGTYPRLPFCIKEKIVPPEPLPPLEKKRVLTKLTQVIEYRIVMNDLPHSMCKPVIENGRVKFTVDHEFEVFLTLMGDTPNLPWRLLNIDILVEDYESKNGRSLVHPQQVAFIHEMVQSKLLESEQPLHDLYNCLLSTVTNFLFPDFFCQSLQLEVLYFQSFTLIKEKFGDFVKVDEYNLGRNLIISYWRDSGKSQKLYPTGCKLNIYVDEKNTSKPLFISHSPVLYGEDGMKSMKQINELKRELEMFTSAKCSIIDFPPLMYLTVSKELEEIIITVDMMKGLFSVTKINSANPYLDALEDSLNGDRKDIGQIFAAIRVFQYKCMYESMLVSHRLQYTDYSQKPTDLHATFGKNFFSVAFPNTNKYTMIIKFSNKDKACVQHFLLKVREMDPVSKRLNYSEMIFVDPAKILESNSINALLNSKKSKASVPLMHMFSNIYSHMEDIILFDGLNDELGLLGIYNSNHLPDPCGIGYSLQITKGISFDTSDAAKIPFNSHDMTVTFRLIKKDKCYWCVLVTASENPIFSLPTLNEQYTRCFLKVYDVSDVKKVVSSFATDWNVNYQMLKIVHDMSYQYNDHLVQGEQTLPSQFYIESFSFNKLVISYGPKRHFLVSVEYCNNTKSFQVTFGSHADSVISNPHSLVSAHLSHHLNKSKSLVLFCKLLAQTCEVNEQLYKLNTTPLVWTKVNWMLPVQNYTVVAQSLFHYRIYYFYPLFCMELSCPNKTYITFKDSSISPNAKLNDASLSGFQAFLCASSDSLCSSNDVTGSIDENNAQHNVVGMSDVDNFLLSDLQMNVFRSAAEKIHQPFLENYVTRDLLTKLMTPINNVSPLDKYLGVQYFRRHLQRIIKSDDSQLIQIPTTEAGVLMFKSDLSGLQLKFNASLVSSPLKIFPLQDTPWDMDDLFSLEKFFEVKVLSHPYKPSNLEAFCSLLKMHFHILKDFINIFRMELNADKNMRWFVQLLLTFPSGFDYNMGANAIVISRKIVFILLLTCNVGHPSYAESTPSSNQPPNVILPLCYDSATNTVQLVENHKQNVNQMSVVANILKRFSDFLVKPNECSILPAIREIIANLT